MKKHVAVVGIAALTAGLMGAAPVFAVDVPCSAGSSCSVPVTATVASSLSFNVTIVELLPDGSGGTTIGPVVTAMNFGNLASNGTFDPDGPSGPKPPQLRSLNSLKAFQVFFGINAQSRPYTIKQTAAKLTSGGNTLPDGSFIVTPLQGVGGDTSPTGTPLPSGTVVAAKRSAVGTGVVLFSRTTNGASNTMAATYGITDDPAHGATEFIPLDQPAGSYVTTIVFSATVT